MGITADRPKPYVLETTSVFNIPRFPLAVHRHREHKSSVLHTHAFSELVVITGGSGIHCTGGTEYPISRGDVFVINRNQIHGYRGEGTLSLVNILFDISKLGIHLKDLKTIPGYDVLFKLEPAWRLRRGFRSRLRLSLKDLTAVEDVIAAMEAELNKRPPGYQFMAVSLLMRLIAYIARCYTQSQAANCHAFIRMAEAVDYLETHYDQPVSLSQLAGLVHLSVRHFQRAFRKVMGTSPVDHLVRLRISRGAELLQQEKDFNITEIAFKVGFQDSNYFARQFRRIMDCSPREYRAGAVGWRRERDLNPRCSCEHT